MIKKREGTKFVAAIEGSEPVKLEPEGERVRVTRAGKLVGFLTRLGFIRTVKGD